MTTFLWDISKAFDGVSQDTLLNKSHFYGFQGGIN